MEHDFDSQGFMAYMKKHFSAMDEHFAYCMVERLVDYAMEHRGHTCDAIPYFLSDMIPELEFGEAAMFAPDSSLTRNGLAEKQAALARLDAGDEFVFHDGGWMRKPA